MVTASKSMSASFSIGSTLSSKILTLFPDPLNGLISIRSLREDGTVPSAVKWIKDNILNSGFDLSLGQDLNMSKGRVVKSSQLPEKVTVYFLTSAGYSSGLFF